MNFHLTQVLTKATTQQATHNGTHWTITAPDGTTHTKADKTHKYTHALIRANLNSPHNYYVSLASSEANAHKEARVLKAERAYIAIIELPR